MTPDRIRLVQSTFAAVRPHATVVAALFYTRLFTLDPSLRTLFTGDLALQGRLLMVMLNAAISWLGQWDALAPVARQLGAHCANCGAREEHYATVGCALMWTLEQCLGDRFTPDAREAWGRTYERLSGAMLQGAAEARAAGLAAI